MIEANLVSMGNILFVLMIFTAGVVFGYWARKSEEDEY
jgi:hypothetical protein|tara:strand:- start:4534 stop:4647 length:114 start_codon:yes stop_codon:yes gene_type:complete